MLAAMSMTSRSSRSAAARSPASTSISLPAMPASHRPYTIPRSRQIAFDRSSISLPSSIHGRELPRSILRAQLGQCHLLPRVGEVDVVSEGVDGSLRDLAQLVCVGGALHEHQVAALDRGAKLGSIVAEVALALDRLGEDV